MYKVAPELDPAWLEFEQEAGLLKPQPIYASPKDRQVAYSQACRSRNAFMLSGRDHDLSGVEILDSVVSAADGWLIPLRKYSCKAIPPRSSSANEAGKEPLVIYYHGGGLRVGDLDSEDLSCRRICKEASIDVISVDYRLMPDHPPDTAVRDAFDAFNAIVAAHNPSKLMVVGSSSGGQLAAQVSQLSRDNASPHLKSIDGLLLRCPVTVDPGAGGSYIPSKFRNLYTSFGPSFQNSLGTVHANSDGEKASNLPLNAETFESLPRTFFQVCSNDIFYSDGICYAEALKAAGVDVKIDVVKGWPHTFWLKAPLLDRALQAEKDMIEGLKWLLSF